MFFHGRGLQKRGKVRKRWEKMKREMDLGRLKINMDTDGGKKGRGCEGKEGRELKGAKKDILFFLCSKSGCCDILTVIQSDTCSRDETMYEQM